MRIKLFTGVLVLTACPVRQAVDDFFEEFGTQPGESSSTTSGEIASSDTSTSTTTAGGESTDGTSESSSGADGDAGDSTSDASTSDASTSDALSTTAETSEPTPFCGDGIVDSLAEECDDGNADDADMCVLCQKVRIIFATSLQLSGETINGLMGADAYCNASANMAKLANPESPLNPGKFRALLSTSTVPAISRHFPGKGPYRLVNGLQVSHSFAALFTEPLENPIDVDEYSQTQTGMAWTGTDVDGSQYPGIDFCSDWHDSFGTANAGIVDATDSKWIHWYLDTDCLSERSIYCVEQE